jgi:DNA-binding transcriptional LysR family regulator
MVRKVALRAFRARRSRCPSDVVAGVPTFCLYHSRSNVSQASLVRFFLLGPSKQPLPLLANTSSLATKLAATIAGYGVAQSVAFGLEPYLKSGASVLSEWLDERYPLYAYHASRRHVPARVRAFLDFVKECLDATKKRPSAVQHTRAQSSTRRRRV